MIRASALLPTFALAMALSACASTKDYPSLARRPAERITGTAEVVIPAPEANAAPALPSADFTARLSQLVEQARRGQGRFTEKRAAAEHLIASADGATLGSESWSVASVALGDLDAARSDALVAMGELDELYTAESVKGDETGDYGNAQAAAAAHAEVRGWIAEEDAILARLRGRLQD